MEERIRSLLEEKNYKILKVELSQMNNSDIAEILSEFDVKDIIVLFRLLKKDDAVDVFASFDPSISTEVLEYLNDKEAVALIEEMYSDDAADVLEEHAEQLLERVAR